VLMRLEKISSPACNPRPCLIDLAPIHRELPAPLSVALVHLQENRP